MTAAWEEILTMSQWWLSNKLKSCSMTDAQVVSKQGHHKRRWKGGMKAVSVLGLPDYKIPTGKPNTPRDLGFILKTVWAPSTNYHIQMSSSGMQWCWRRKTCPCVRCAQTVLENQHWFPPFPCPKMGKICPKIFLFHAALHCRSFLLQGVQ